MRKEPIRMCIACRKRDSQSVLVRLQFINNRLIPYSGSGRSIYVCKECCKDRVKITKLSKRFKIDKEALKVMLKGA